MNDDDKTIKGPRTVSGSFTAKLDDEFVKLLRDMTLPACPVCGFTHASALWVRCAQRCPFMHCAGCGAALLHVYSINTL